MFDTIGPKMKNKNVSNFRKMLIKDVRAKVFYYLDSFFKLLLYNELLGSEMKDKMRATAFVSEIKWLEKYPDFEK